MIRWILAMCLIAGATACGRSTTSPSPSLVSFQAAGALASGPAAVVTAQASAHRIEIIGSTDTPTPCYALDGDVSSNGSELELRVSARALDNANCVLAIGRFSYNAAVSLPAGTYSLRVLHAYPNTGWPTTEALKQTIKVD